MSGMGDGYVGTAQDAVRIRRLEKQREAERRKINELKSKTASAKGQPGLLQFGSGTLENLESAFKKETIGLVTREQYVEKRVTIQSKLEEEEKEKLDKLRKQEEEILLQKRKKRKAKGNARLSFADDFHNCSEDEEGEKKESKLLVRGKVGKDPTVETSFLPDRVGEDAISVSGRQKSKLSVRGYENSGFVSKNRLEMSLLKLLTATGMELAIEECSM